MNIEKINSERPFSKSREVLKKLVIVVPKNPILLPRIFAI
jgi:hypothetical protein